MDSHHDVIVMFLYSMFSFAPNYSFTTAKLLFDIIIPYFHVWSTLWYLTVIILWCLILYFHAMVVFITFQRYGNIRARKYWITSIFGKLLKFCALWPACMMENSCLLLSKNFVNFYVYLGLCYCIFYLENFSKFLELKIV